MPLEERYLKELAKMSEENLLRQDILYQGSDFISNDYFSLKEDQAYLSYLSQADQLPPTGSTGSRYLGGYHLALEECENYLKDYYGAYRVFLFPAGYLANVALLPALTSPHDLILYDELCHASLKDGVRLSLAKSFPWRHLDLQDLESKVKRLRPAKGEVFIVCEAIYSMDGDSVALKEILQFCETYEAYLILDEAHSIGLLGQHGKGLAYGYTSPYLLATMLGFGKAFALSGAAVLLYQPTTAHYFSQKARPLIYSTALPPRFCRQLLLAHQFFLTHQAQLLRELNSKIQLFVQLAQRQEFTANPTHPIQILKIGNRSLALALAHFLRNHQMAVKAILPPTVRAGSERLRLTLHRKNKEEEIQTLCHFLGQFLASRIYCHES